MELLNATVTSAQLMKRDLAQGSHVTAILELPQKTIVGTVAI